MKFIIPILILTSLFAFSEEMFFADSSGMLGKIKAGVQMAGKFLDNNFLLDRAGKIAEMVSDTFKSARKIKENSEKDPNIFSGFLRLFGMSSKKLSAIAVNAIIFVAQLISTSLSKTPPSQLTEARNVKNGEPFDWLMNNSKVLELLTEVKDKNLTKSIVEHIKERSLDEDTDCIQLLICKSTPFVWGMQRALESGKKTTAINKGKKAFFEHLPSREEVEDYGNDCEKNHPYCLIY